MQVLRYRRGRSSEENRFQRSWAEKDDSASQVERIASVGFAFAAFINDFVAGGAYLVLEGVKWRAKEYKRRLTRAL
jgi:hypothetical protein